MCSKKGFVIICLVILTALLITSCTSKPVAVTGVTLDQASMTLTVGEATGTLVATVAPATATNKSVTWSSSAPEVATVVDGVVTPIIEGTTTITVTTVDGGFTTTCELTVVPVVVAATGVTLDQASMTLTVGEATGTLVATVAPATATKKNLTWSSSAPEVATVVDGVVTPIIEGAATIIVTTVDGGLTATCELTVALAGVAVTGVTLDQASMTLTAGEATGTLVATVAPATATNKSVTWFSSAPEVATVVDGVVTPIIEGTTTIIVTTVDGGFTATCELTVVPAVVAATGVTLDQASMTLTVGEATGTLVATVAPATATNQSVTWSSSAPEVATVVDGVVTPIIEGAATIIVTTVDGGFTATCELTVVPAVVAVTGVTLDQASMTLTAGEATRMLVATVVPATATNKSVTWSSSAPAVAAVVDGVVTPIIEGTTTITVTTVDGDFTAT